MHTIIERVQKERVVRNVLILPNSSWVLMISRNQKMCTAEQSWSKCGLTVISACLPWKAIWQLDRTVWNFFLEDKFLLWLASAFDLFLLPAWNSWGNSNFPGTIISIVWWATETGTNISLEYLRSYQNNYTCPSFHHAQAGPLNPWPPDYDWNTEYTLATPPKRSATASSPHIIHSVLTTPSCLR